MRGEKFYEMLDLLDDNLVLESAEVKRKVWRRRLGIVAAIVGAIVVIWFLTTIPARFPPDDVGGEIGKIQNGAYYVYAGSGMPMPNEVRVPQGIFRCVPGEEKALVVSAKEHKLNVLFPSWGVNSHGLYYIDQNTNELWRQDLVTGQEMVLYAAPVSMGEEEQEEPEKGALEVMQGILAGELPKERYDVALFLDNVEEEVVRFTYRASDGETSYTITVDSRTGEVLSQVLQEGEGYSQYIGPRQVQVVWREHPKGFTYPNWEDDMAYNAYHWEDVLEHGQSILPPGTMLGEHGIEEIQGGLLVGYCRQGQFDEDGNYLRWSTEYLLLTPDGENDWLPREENGIRYYYGCVHDDWLYYVAEEWAPLENGGRRIVQSLCAKQLKTGEVTKIQGSCIQGKMVTDGTWLYVANGSRTDCYRLTRDETGRPLEVALVEEGI